MVSRVKAALTTENLVFHGKTTGTYGPSATWAYGHSVAVGGIHRESLPATPCPAASARTAADPSATWPPGTARAGGKLTGAYVTYYNREYSLSPITAALPTSACSRTARLEMSGPAATPGDHWADFINATVACGAAKVTGHVWINGVQTIQITGKPITVRLPPGEAKAVREKWARDGWTLYVDPSTYLPVRMTGWNATFGGPAPRTSGSDSDRRAVAEADRGQHRQGPGHHPARLPPGAFARQPVTRRLPHPPTTTARPAHRCRAGGAHAGAAASRRAANGMV